MAHVIIENGIIEAKRKLYHLLLCKPHGEWTKSEVNIAFELSKDDDIQKILEDARRSEQEIRDKIGSGGR